SPAAAASRAQPARNTGRRRRRRTLKVVSQQYRIKLLPFFLEGVAGNKSLMQNDQIHPNAKAQPIMLNLAYPYIRGAL
ncbi:hypothetical protein MR369_34800, partial [Pseudomonas aeruginosa]